MWKKQKKRLNRYFKKSINVFNIYLKDWYLFIINFIKIFLVKLN